MADNIQETHRSGPLKQQNKPHKHGKHKSKGSISLANKGRIGIKSLTSGKKQGVMRKVDRRNQLHQLRANKRHETLMEKRAVGAEGSAPHLILCLPLFGGIGCREQLHSLLCSACNNNTKFSSTTNLVFHQAKQRFTVIFPPSDDLYVVLDMAKVADSILLVHNAAEKLDLFGELCLDCITAQGLPSTVHAVQGMENIPFKKRGEVRKQIIKRVLKWFPKDKLRSLETIQDAVNVLRFIGNQKLRPVSCRDTHSHLVVESAQFSESSKSEEQGVLSVTGYVRNRALSVNGLVHITGVGNFQMGKITAAREPLLVKPQVIKRSNGMEVDTEDASMKDHDEERVLEVADMSRQEPLASEVELDPMEGEQTWPTEEDEAEALTRSKGDKRAALIEEYDALEGEEEEEDEEEGGYEISEDDDTETEVIEIDSSSVTFNDDNYDANMDFEEERKYLELLHAEREDQTFPDEVDTPLNIPAKVRFARYRGLKSFRSSPWDPKENLPRDYARIVQFQNFRRTKKRALNRDNDEGVMPGWYVTVHIKDVPRSFAKAVDLSSTPLVIQGLLPHENKMSVVNFMLKRTPRYNEPIKSKADLKERLVFHCGVHRYSACPIYSQHNLGDKHKYERFLHNGVNSVASVYAPIGYPPSPVLVFKEVNDAHVLVATGSLLSVNPDRIVCKKIVLSGHPYKVNRRSAVIRYMFFNREDIQWFKPVELRTKCGLRGHIKDCLGTHGHMKCVFDKPLKAHDTVLMNLYKRVFPKWTYQLEVPRPLKWVRSFEDDDQLDSSMHT